MMFEWTLIVVTKVTVLFLAAALVTWMMRHRAATARHLVWAASLLSALAIPVLECGPGLSFLPRWSASPTAVSPSPETPPIDPRRDSASSPDALIVAPVSGDTKQTSAVASGEKPRLSPASRSVATTSPMAWVPSTAQVLGMVWFIGVILLLARLMSGWSALRRVATNAAVDSDPRLVATLNELRRALGVRRRITLLLCGANSGPMTWGLTRPVVALPADATKWSVSRLRAVLLHEVAHVARMDSAMQFLGRLAGIVFWFHPLAWLAMRRLHLEQERACDDVVLRGGMQPSGYAEDLMGIAATLKPIPAAALVSTAIARPSELMSRMKYLLDSEQARQPLTLARRRGAIAVTVIIAGLLGAARPMPAPQDKQDKQKLATRLVSLLDLASHRDQAIHELGEMGTPALVALRKALKDKREIVVNGAVTALGKNTAPKKLVASILLVVFQDTTSPNSTRLLCAKILGPQIDEYDAVFAAFMAVMDESGDPNLGVEVLHYLTGSLQHRGEVGRALARMKTGKASPEAGEFQKRVTRLINSLDVRAWRGSAVRDLRKIRGRAFPQLVEAMRDPRRQVREKVISILVTPRPTNDQVAHHLIAVMTSRDPELRGGLVKYLTICMQHDAKVIDQVLKIVRDDRSDRVCSDMVAALTGVQQSATRITAKLSELFVAGRGERCIAIMRGFSAHPNFGGDRNKVLWMGLDHDDPAVVEFALRTLIRDYADAKRARKKVEALAGHQSARVRRAQKDFLATLDLRANFTFTGILVCDYSDNKILEFDKNGKLVFQIKEIFGVWDVEKLANGNYLLTEFSVNRVSEVTPKNKIVWSFEDLKNPYDADRLPNGNTLIADTFGRRVVEVNRKGKIVWSYDKDIHPYDVDRLANGNTLIADTHDDRVIEVDKNGKIVWEIRNLPNVHDADRLPNGNTLLTIRMLNEVREVDKAGKTVWRLKNLSSPSDADRLADGTTIVAENGFVRIFSPAGIEIWRKTVTWAVEVNVLNPGK